MIEIIVAVLTLIGVIISNVGSNRKIEHSLEISQSRLIQTARSRSLQGR